MSAIRWQGLAFCAVATLASVYCALFANRSSPVSLPTLAALIVALGVPHGALDAMLAAETFQLRKSLAWILFASGYLTLVLLVMAGWESWPFPMLVLFLLVSVSHFSGDPEGECPQWIRLLYGGAPIVLPALLHGPELATLLSGLVSAEEASQLVAFLDRLAWPWLISLGLAILRHGRRHWLGAGEMAAQATLSLVAPPLMAFTVFFCGMHSARHILRCLQGKPPDKWKTAALAAFSPMVATFLLLGLYWANAGDLALEPRIVRTVFVGLAALTLPHVILVDGIQRHRTS